MIYCIETDNNVFDGVKFNVLNIRKHVGVDIKTYLGKISVYMDGIGYMFNYIDGRFEYFIDINFSRTHPDSHGMYSWRYNQLYNLLSNDIRNDKIDDILN